MRKWLRWGAILGLVVLSGGVAVAWWALAASRAALDGDLTVSGLSAPASVHRDRLGVVTIDASNERDAMRALGFVHAQERFFEMDLMRRSAAGELSALFGPVALERDKQARMHRLRARVDADLAHMAGTQLATITAYAEGVDAGLAALRARPWPYLLLRTQPEPWRISDTALAGYALFFDLHDENNRRELSLWRIRQVVPDALYRLIAVNGSEWDAPLLGEPYGNAPLPGPEVLDLRTLPTPENDDDLRVINAHPLAAQTPREGSNFAEPLLPGSNNFAVAGALTADGRAIVANDMHLGLRAPNIWFRARLRYPDRRAPTGQVDVSGFTLPGVPAVIVGSNSHIAWGFTNAYGDWLDWYRVQYTDASHTRYATPDGDQPVRVSQERIVVKGAPDTLLAVRETRWGPIMAHDGDDGLALRWTAHQGGLNFDLGDFAHAADLDAALVIARGVGIPAQNLLIADASGRIAWQLLGRIPHRVGGCDPRAPLDPMAGCDWEGFEPQPPQLIDPPAQRLWSANARVADGEALAMIGDSGYALGARAAQIRDGLFAREQFTEADLLAIQRDDRSVFLSRWHRLMQAQANTAGDDALDQLAALAASWDEHASTTARSYPLVRAWRLAVIKRIELGLLAPARVALGADIAMPYLAQIEGVAWPLVETQPAHLLARRFASWQALFGDAAREVLDSAEVDASGQARPWGERNTAAICHPLANALPSVLRATLCMAFDPLPGDNNMPRVQGPAFGASERMVVAPGHEAQGVIHMPGGTSGNPLSPFWAAGHDDWVQGKHTPFLPGETRHTLRLSPGRD